jgi:Ulp1 family protease
VFLPINIKETHWYLAIINAKRKEMQILDSTGPKDHSELIDVFVVVLLLYYSYN